MEKRKAWKCIRCAETNATYEDDWSELVLKDGCEYCQKTNDECSITDPTDTDEDDGENLF